MHALTRVVPISSGPHRLTQTHRNRHMNNLASNNLSRARLQGHLRMYFHNVDYGKCRKVKKKNYCQILIITALWYLRNKFNKLARRIKLDSIMVKVFSYLRSTVYLQLWPVCRQIFIINNIVRRKFTISTPWFSRKSLVAQTVRGGTSSWNRTKLFWMVALAQGKILCWGIRVCTCWLMVPSNRTSSLLPPKWNTAQTMTDEPTLLCSMHTDINVLLTLPPTVPSSSICAMQLESWQVS